MTAAETYASQIDDYNAQRARVYGDRLPPDSWAAGVASFRQNPRRELTGILSKLATFVDPDDVITDVGGGAGYLSLPLALRCRQVINMDASPGMLKESMSWPRRPGSPTSDQSFPTGWTAKICPATWR